MNYEPESGSTDKEQINFYKHQVKVYEKACQQLYRFKLQNELEKYDQMLDLLMNLGYAQEKLRLDHYEIKLDFELEFIDTFTKVRDFKN